LGLVRKIKKGNNEMKIGKNLSFTLILLISICLINSLKALNKSIQFIELPLNLPLLNYVDCQWIDYDNDGDLDIITSGMDSNLVKMTKLYRNNGDKTFSDSDLKFTNLYLSTISVIDYNQDGYMDFIISGCTEKDNYKTILYKNSQNGFIECNNCQIDNVKEAVFSWGDFDNDDDWDLFISGQIDFNSHESIVKVYKNIGNDSFSELKFNFFGNNSKNISVSTADWVDLNNDKKLDLIISGFSLPLTIYVNADNDNFTLYSIGKYKCAYGDLAFIDIDLDDDLDIILNGEVSWGNYSTKLLVNEGNLNFQESNDNFIKCTKGSTLVFDYDNDNDLDLLLCGRTGVKLPATLKYETKVYENKNGNLIESEISLPDAKQSRLGDFDNDGDIDILINRMKGQEEEKIVLINLEVE
jgi:hypothetical protein